MLTEDQVARLLAPFGLQLTSRQLGLLVTYLELLIRWNRRINLTSVRDPEECVTRHFGESLYLARWVELKGTSLDIGSGAGFPGLALKIAFPALSVTLLEPVAKKRAFLKEVARACGMEAVEVRAERLEDFEGAPSSFDAATSRAVGGLERLIPRAARLLKPGGKLALWLTQGQGKGLRQIESAIEWRGLLSLPLAREREIRIGTRKENLPGNY
ncbi:MAG TPA: 16S rRNA (guanine(527)-N(7))-methyltransferase RsmG [Terriglobia bacterium]|nr:16S rRNA (guanine(527)-N(7))-methyltransferase RsmG [Terriglobia bacterium]